MPRRYHAYPAEFQVLNVLSSAGASILGVGYLMPMIYLIWSLRYGRLAGANPWGAVGLEWTTTSPPPTENFAETPIVTWERRTTIRRPWRATLPDDATAHAAHAHHPALAHHFDDLEQQQRGGDARACGCSSLTEVLFFGGLFLAYAVYRALVSRGVRGRQPRARHRARHHQHRRAHHAAA